MAIPYASARRSANLASKVYTLHSLPYPLALLWSRKLDETSVKGRLLKTLLGFPHKNLQSDCYQIFLPAARSGGRSRSHFVTRQSSVNKLQISHLEALYAESAQSKDV